MNYIKKFRNYSLLNLAFTFILLFFIFFKSIVVQISYDEAFSFLQYTYTKNFFNIGLANNHLLNTLLIYPFSLIDLSEFFLRLPNILSGVLYIFICLNLSEDSNNKTLTFTILTLCPYLIEFFSIARGYGISTFLILSGLYFFINESKKWIFLSPICFLLSSFSINIMIIFLWVFVFVNYKTYFLKIDLKKIALLLVLSFFTLGIIFTVFTVTSDGKPIYGIENISFSYLLLSSFGIVELYKVNNILIKILFSLIFFLPLLFFRIHEDISKRLTLISFGSLFLAFLLPLVFEKPFPQLRILLPFLPGLLISISTTINSLINRYKNSMKNLSYLLIIFLSLNMISTLDLDSYYDWKAPYERSNFTDFTIDKDTLDCEFTYEEIPKGAIADYYHLLASEKNVSYCDRNSGKTIFNE
tara:strand:- start:324 stop:1565 length:1242 start_codon:yes stop_codon:yes gene_type:complete